MNAGTKMYGLRMSFQQNTLSDTYTVHLCESYPPPETALSSPIARLYY